MFPPGSCGKLEVERAFINKSSRRLIRTSDVGERSSDSCAPDCLFGHLMSTMRRSWRWRSSLSIWIVGPARQKLFPIGSFLSSRVSSCAPFQVGAKSC